MSDSQLDKSKEPDQAFRLELYKTAHLEAKTLLACGHKASEISVKEIYERLVKEQNEQAFPSKKDFKRYESHCRAHGVKPYRL